MDRGSNLRSPKESGGLRKGRARIVAAVVSASVATSIRFVSCRDRSRRPTRLAGISSPLALLGRDHRVTSRKDALVRVYLGRHLCGLPTLQTGFFQSAHPAGRACRGRQRLHKVR